MAVLSFPYTDGNESADSPYIRQRLTSSIQKLGILNVAENELVDRLIEQYELPKSGAITKQDAEILGTGLGVEALVVGRLLDIGNHQIKVTARLVTVKTAKVLADHSITVKQDRLETQKATQKDKPFVDATASREFRQLWAELDSDIPTSAFDISPGVNLIVAASRNGSILIKDIKTNRIKRLTQGNEEKFDYDPSFSPDGKAIYFCRTYNYSHDNKFLLLEVRDAAPPKPFLKKEKPPRQSTKPEIIKIDERGNEEKVPISVEPEVGTLRYPSVSSDGKYMVFVGQRVVTWTEKISRGGVGSGATRHKKYKALTFTTYQPRIYLYNFSSRQTSLLMSDPNEKFGTRSGALGGLLIGGLGGAVSFNYTKRPKGFSLPRFVGNRLYFVEMDLQVQKTGEIDPQGTWKKVTSFLGGESQFTVRPDPVIQKIYSLEISHNIESARVDKSSFRLEYAANKKLKSINSYDVSENGKIVVSASQFSKNTDFESDDDSSLLIALSSLHLWDVSEGRSSKPVRLTEYEGVRSFFPRFTRSGEEIYFYMYTGGNNEITKIKYR